MQYLLKGEGDKEADALLTAAGQRTEKTTEEPSDQQAEHSTDSASARTEVVPRRSPERLIEPH